ncbi:TPA: hypothetical protein RI821_003073 [Vibrio cholerae]|nr:hypothetical protein [Vibrio cholerae]
MASAFFRVTHEYDIGDRSVYFSFDESLIDETAKELAVYLQFKVEHEVDDSIAVDNVTVVRFLELFGAKQLETKPNADFVTIDMYWDRERSCGDWFLENYKLLVPFQFNSDRLSYQSVGSSSTGTKTVIALL